MAEIPMRIEEIVYDDVKEIFLVRLVSTAPAVVSGPPVPEGGDSYFVSEHQEVLETVLPKPIKKAPTTLRSVVTSPPSSLMDVPQPHLWEKVGSGSWADLGPCMGDGSPCPPEEPPPPPPTPEELNATSEPETSPPV